MKINIEIITVRTDESVINNNRAICIKTENKKEKTSVIYYLRESFFFVFI
jgi:hypothetical protein